MEHIKTLSLSLLALGLSLGCQNKSDHDDTQPVHTAGAGGSGGSAAIPADAAGGQPDEEKVRKGERGSSCNSTNDCEEELSCICPTGGTCANKSCQPSNFNLTGTGKSCHVSDCKTKADCCGEMPLKAPEKCANRESICNRPTLTGCTTITCTTSATCGAGKCEGSCSLNSVNKCLTTADCPTNTCDLATNPDTCTITGTDCSLSTCTLNSCLTPRCNCTNPDYAPTSPICTDPDCEGICGFTCTDERCVADTSCNSDIQCAASTPFCSNGKCSECRTSADCDEEECIAGHCGPACKADTQCSLFEVCQAGECVFVGCRSDRECVLQARAKNDPLAQDPRLAKCSVENDLGTCVFPCEIDAQCATTEVCLSGVCKYIGCETNSECTTIAGLHNLPVPTPERPWTTTAVCEAEDAATP